MLAQDCDIIAWIDTGLRPRITLSQLTTLLEMWDAQSVAALQKGNVSEAVNARQKIERLERALEIGPLTHKIHNRTQLNEAGRAVAAEFRALCVRLNGLAQRDLPTVPVFTIGAGDSLIQTAIGPLAVQMACEYRSRWRILNLRSAEITRGLAEGTLDFGVLRTADIPTRSSLKVLRGYSGPDLTLVVGRNPGGPHDPAVLLERLCGEPWPFIQQGSSWPPIRARILAKWNPRAGFAELEPAVICDTHTEAAAAAIEGEGWCIVPAPVARMLARAGTIQKDLRLAAPSDDISLVASVRFGAYEPDRGVLVERLKRRLGVALSVAKSTY